MQTAEARRQSACGEMPGDRQSGEQARWDALLMASISETRSKVIGRELGMKPV